MSEAGFNLNFSNEGTWGKAIYFALKSSYSNAFAYSLEKSQRQMFMAKVIVGKTIVMQAS